VIRVEFDPGKLTGEDRIWWDRWSKRATDATNKAIEQWEDWYAGKRDKPFQCDFNSSIWIELKTWLLKNVFHFKCAYCETPIVQFYGDAEHYRPKGRVSYRKPDGTPEYPVCPDETSGASSKTFQHPGYFWLAYYWRNLVPSCESCNTGAGKGDQFPVQDQYVIMKRLTADQLTKLKDPPPLQSIRWPGVYYLRSVDLDAMERPALLNPLCSATDITRHLCFGKKGIIAAVDKSALGRHSIAVYNLKKEELRKERQRAQERIYSKYFGPLQAFESPAEAKQKILSNLEEYRTGVEPYSRAALDFLKIARREEADVAKAVDLDL
jgi:hypothetical protein